MFPFYTPWKQKTFGFLVFSGGRNWEHWTEIGYRIINSLIFWNSLIFTHFRTLIFLPANIYLFIDNYRNSRQRCEICSKLTIKTPERCHWRRSCVFIVNFEQVNVSCVYVWKWVLPLVQAATFGLFCFP